MLLLLLRKFEVVSDDAQDVVATFELVAAITTHRQMLDDLDDARLKQACPGLAERSFRRAADQPLQLVAKRVAEMFCDCRTVIHNTGMRSTRLSVLQAVGHNLTMLQDSVIPIRDRMLAT